MRHKKGFNHLGRKSAHRQAMLSNMAASLIIHKRISTTIQKAKALRSYVEPLITRSKEDSMHNRRVVFSYLQNKEAVNELFREISDKIADRPGGYTRILKTGVRAGDDAQMCIIELVDYNDNLIAAKDEKAGNKRTRRGRTKKTDEAPKAEVKKEKVTKVEEVKDETPVEEPKEELKDEVKEEEVEVKDETPVEETEDEVKEEQEEVKEEAPAEEEVKEEETKEEEQAPEEGEEDEKKDEEEPSK